MKRRRAGHAIPSRPPQWSFASFEPTATIYARLNYVSRVSPCAARIPLWSRRRVAAAPWLWHRPPNSRRPEDDAFVLFRWNHGHVCPGPGQSGHRSPSPDVIKIFLSDVSPARFDQILPSPPSHGCGNRGNGIRSRPSKTHSALRVFCSLSKFSPSLFERLTILEHRERESITERKRERERERERENRVMKSVSPLSDYPA